MPMQRPAAPSATAIPERSPSASAYDQTCHETDTVYNVQKCRTTLSAAIDWVHTQTDLWTVKHMAPCRLLPSQGLTKTKTQLGWDDASGRHVAG